MNLNNFTIKEPRALPVFLIVDASGSMEGNKIGQVNVALQEMLMLLKNVRGARGQIKLCIIQVAHNVEIIQPLANIEKIEPVQLVARGRTPLGQAIEQTVDLMQNPEIVKKRDFAPIFIVMSDGIPTDITREMYDTRPISEEMYKQWAPIEKLHKAISGEQIMKLALGIGEDADFNVLRAIVNNPTVPVIRAKDIVTIEKFFKFVTRTITQKSVSANPNAMTINDIPFDEIFDEIELV